MIAYMGDKKYKTIICKLKGTQIIFFLPFLGLPNRSGKCQFLKKKSVRRFMRNKMSVLGLGGTSLQIEKSIIIFHKFFVLSFK